MKWRNFRRGCGVLALLLVWPSLGAALVQGPLVAGGNSHSLAIRADGTLWAWGGNTYGQLGLEDTADRLTPVRVGGGNWVAVAAGFAHTLAIRADGTLWAWGRNNQGQLGVNDTTNRFVPTQEYRGFSDWAGVAAGHYHSLGRRTDGTCWTWGANTHGQLGQGDTTSRPAPTQVRFPGALPGIPLLLLDQ